MPESHARSAAYFFGEFRLIINGRHVTTWHAGKARALFQYLYTHRNRSVSRDHLRQTLWPDLAPSCGTTSVKSAVYGARMALRTVGRAAAPVEIQSIGQGYRLRVDGLWSDVEAFTRSLALAAAARRAGDREATLSSYQEAVELYRGPFLASDDVDWAVDQRECLRSQALLAVRQLWKAAIDAGDCWSALTWSHRALEVDPDDLTTYDLLVAANHRLGLTGQAHRWDELAQDRFADAG